MYTYLFIYLYTSKSKPQTLNEPQTVTKDEHSKAVRLVTQDEERKQARLHHRNPPLTL